MDPNIIIAGITSITSILNKLISSAKNKKDSSSEQLYDLQGKLLELQSNTFSLIEENHSLRSELQTTKEKLDRKEEIEHHPNYLTLKKDSLKIKYCSICYGKNEHLIPLNCYEQQGFADCHECKNRIILDKDLFGQYSKQLYNSNRRMIIREGYSIY